LKTPLFSFAICALLFGCVDPTHDHAVDALGGETAGVPVGPLHRAGQPCLTCHGGDGPADAEFSVAGTAYMFAYKPDPALNVSVVLNDIDGRAVSIGTNQVGNFYINASDWRPIFPLQTKLTFGAVQSQMQTVIGRAGSCADCHQEKVSVTSPGHVWFSISPDALAHALATE
jgi:hypothetical protein